MFNIASCEKGLGGALTNPTELSRKKGNISRKYTLVYEGREYPDLESAYLLCSEGKSPEEKDTMMVEMIAMKFQQHPELYQEVKDKGGAEWLKTCGHFTGAKTERFKSWEGLGLDSRFIRNLVKGFEETTKVISKTGQQLGLF